MNEKESITKVEKEKGGLWNKVSLLCAILAWLFPIVCVLLTVVIVQVFEHLNKTPSETEVFRLLFPCVSIVPLVLCLIALLIGVSCIVKFKLKNRNARVNNTITSAVLFGLLGLGILWFYIRPLLIRIDLSVRRMESLGDLNRLGTAMFHYIGEYNGKWPLPDRWCDLLLQSGYATKEDLLFKSIGQEDRYYAINPNCGPNSPPDTVLLFEAKGGWNQFGGPEILTTENHKGEGCNILFSDKHVYFVKKEELGELDWGDAKE